MRETNATYVTRSLETCERLKQIDDMENELKSKIEHLESTIKAEQKGKADLISALTQEKAKCMSLEQSIQLLDKRHVTISTQLASATEELTKSKSLLENYSKPEVIVEKEFIAKPCENCPAKDAEFNQLQLNLVQLRAEIVKTKELLKTQISINKEYQEEVNF